LVNSASLARRKLGLFAVAKNRQDQTPLGALSPQIFGRGGNCLHGVGAYATLFIQTLCNEYIIVVFLLFILVVFHTHVV